MMETEWCKHGHLKRACQLCEKDARIAELEAEVERKTEALTRIADQWIAADGKFEPEGEPEYEDGYVHCVAEARAALQERTE